MSFYVTGDIHGESRHFIARIESMEEPLTSSDTLLCLGDVGIKYGKFVAGRLLDYLSSLPCEVVVLRGNHDARYWRDMRRGTFGDDPQVVEWNGGLCMRDGRRPNVLYLPDEGGSYDVAGNRCLMVPGAWSIDWEIRLSWGYPYEREEQLTLDERTALLRLAEEQPVDYVFSHTCPNAWLGSLSDLFMPNVDPHAIDKTMEFMMDDLLRSVRGTCKGWYFGHYHEDRSVGGFGRLLLNDVVKVF